MSVYTAGGTYDALTNMAQCLYDAGLDARVTLCLVVYIADSGQLAIAQAMTKSAGLTLRPYCEVPKTAPKASKPKMRRSW